MSAFNKGRLRRCSSPQPHYGLSALQQHLQILLRRGDRGNMKVFHEIVQYIRREERRQGGAKANILDAQMQQRQQDTHRLLLIPRKHQRQRQVVDPTAERLRQGQRDFDSPVGIVALSYIHQPRQPADFSQIKIIETEFAAQSKEKADEEAIRVFTENLRQLLLAAPLGQKRVLAIDPGFRTGCKVVCLDAQGNLIHNENIYPHPPVNKPGEAASKLRKMIEAYQIEAISIGNGTASRETEDFINRQTFDRQIPVFMVSEQGASIYSASKIARDEFPDYDVTVRGAVSIGRRLMDPLAELVKIDPKSIGVGQYQHDVDQTKLKKALDQTVENCVNLVGVNLNTASSHLLTYISGLGPQLAQNIVNYRVENGAFNSRKELMKVPRMGAKAFEQCAGFLRIPGAKNPLDNTAVHPESYHIVEQMAKDLKCTVDELIANKELRQKINISDYLTPTVGLPTLQDILQELDKPGRDPRKTIKVFEFDKNVRTINDLREGMILPGIVGNITNFGAFVDIGIKENGLVHLSQLAERYISDPTEIVSIHQQVMVKIINVDTDRKRIQLSMIGVPQD